MPGTASYTAPVLANILLDSIEESNAQFALELLGQPIFQARALNTALHLLAWRGTDLRVAAGEPIDVIASLIDAGANPGSMDESARTVPEIARACLHPSEHVIQFLEQQKQAAEKAKGTTAATPEMSQVQRSKQFQDLAGKNAVMPHIKAANACAQMRALEPVIRRKDLNHVCILDLGGGDGLLHRAEGSERLQGNSQPTER